MTLKLHHLRPAPGAKKAKTRKGRGEASKGKTAGRGGKGTRARNTELNTKQSMFQQLTRYFQKVAM
jgi:ribosomal protein L15